jgi:hypothetical protein
VSRLALIARGPCLHVLLPRDFTLSEPIMTKPRSWIVTRGWMPHPGAQRHWDRAYQVVLHMAAKHPDEIALGTAARLTPKESHHAGHSRLRPGLYPAPSLPSAKPRQTPLSSSWSACAPMSRLEAGTCRWSMSFGMTATAAPRCAAPARISCSR